MNILNILTNHFNSNKSLEIKDSSISKSRIDAWEHFIKIGFPNNNNENYKYTNISKFLDQNFDNSSTIFLPQFSFIENENSYDIIINFRENFDFENRYLQENIFKNYEKFGFILTYDPDKIETPFLKEDYINTDPFKLLNIALNPFPIFIKILDNTKIIKPINIIFKLDFNNTISHPRILVNLGESSSASILTSIETDSEKTNLSTYKIPNETIFLNSNIEVVLEKNSNLNFGIINQHKNDSNLHSLNNTYFTLKKDSNLNIDTISLGGRLTRNNLSIDHEGEQSHSNLNGIYYISENQHIDNNTSVNHLVSNTSSSEIYKGILTGKSIGVFNGKIFVDKDAQKINALQTNKNLLLSPSSKIKTKPQLEIFANDVKCSHGATIGQIDEEQLFYLRSRGISIDECYKLLINAFISEIIDDIEDPFIQEKSMGALTQKILTTETSSYMSSIPEIINT